MNYEFIKQTSIYTTVKMNNEVVVFEKKEQTDSSHEKMEAWFVDGLVNNKIKYVAIAEFEKWNGNFIKLTNIEKY